VISVESKNYFFYELWFGARSHALLNKNCKCFDCAIFYFVKSEYLPLRQTDVNSCIHQISLFAEGMAHSYTVPFASEITSEKVLGLVDTFLKASGKLGLDWNALVLHETFSRLINTQLFQIIHSLDFLSEFTIVCKGILSNSGQDQYWPEYRELIIKSLFDSEGDTTFPFMVTLSAQELELKKIEDFSIPAQVLASRNEKLAEEFNRSERAAAEAVKAATAQYELKFGSEFKKANDVEKRKIEIHLALVSHVSRVPIIELDYEMDKLLIMENFDAWIPQPWIIQASNVTLSI